MHGADEGDILIVEFDLVAKKAALRLGDDELLQEYAPDLGQVGPTGY